MSDGVVDKVPGGGCIAATISDFLHGALVDLDQVNDAFQLHHLRRSERGGGNMVIVVEESADGFFDRRSDHRDRR